MGSLLDRLTGTDSSQKTPEEIPDTIPEEWGDEYAPDPTPGDPPPARTKLTPKTSGTVTPTLRKRITAEVEMYIEFAAMPIMLRDDVCGAAIHAQAKPIAEAICQILSKYPDLAHKFLATSGMADWIKLAMALQPVGKVIWEHHVTNPDRPDDEGVPLDLDDFPVYRPGT